MMSMKMMGMIPDPLVHALFLFALNIPLVVLMIPLVVFVVCIMDFLFQ